MSEPDGEHTIEFENHRKPGQSITAGSARLAIIGRFGVWVKENGRPKPAP
jgi:hypothetical protein